MIKKIAFSIFLGIIVLAGSATLVIADEYKIDVDATRGIKDILSDNTGKIVQLRFVSGGDIEGRVTKVGNSLVHISRISRLEFYDAVVSIDKISAVIVRARESLKN